MSSRPRVCFFYYHGSIAMWALCKTEIQALGIRLRRQKMERTDSVLQSTQAADRKVCSAACQQGCAGSLLARSLSAHGLGWFCGPCPAPQPARLQGGGPLGGPAGKSGKEVSRGRAPPDAPAAACLLLAAAAAASPLLVLLHHICRCELGPLLHPPTIGKRGRRSSVGTDVRETHELAVRPE